MMWTRKKRKLDDDKFHIRQVPEDILKKVDLLYERDMSPNGQGIERSPSRDKSSVDLSVENLRSPLRKRSTLTV